MDLLIGTSNPGKLREYADLLSPLPMRLLNLRDAGLEGVDIEEPFDTFEGNARHKAAIYAERTGLLTLADDSGLVVDALDGRPGVYSARYGPTARERYMKLLDELQGVVDEQRTARFVCVVAVADPRTGYVETARGTVEGRIAHVPGTGQNGFGYDPVFIPDGYDVPLSDLPMQVKNAIDHRGNAVRAILPYLLTLVEG